MQKLLLYLLGLTTTFLCFNTYADFKAEIPSEPQNIYFLTYYEGTKNNQQPENIVVIFYNSTPNTQIINKVLYSVLQAGIAMNPEKDIQVFARSVNNGVTLTYYLDYNAKTGKVKNCQNLTCQ